MPLCLRDQPQLLQVHVLPDGDNEQTLGPALAALDDMLDDVSWGEVGVLHHGGRGGGQWAK